jgi:hypothetical protein
MDDEQWWATHAPLLRKVLDPAAYPLAVRVGTAAGTAHRAAYSAQYAYGFGLQTIISGLAPLISADRSDGVPGGHIWEIAQEIPGDAS